jgi:hypothetical protein
MIPRNTMTTRAKRFQNKNAPYDFAKSVKRGVKGTINAERIMIKKIMAQKIRCFSRDMLHPPFSGIVIVHYNIYESLKGKHNLTFM